MSAAITPATADRLHCRALCPRGTPETVGERIVVIGRLDSVTDAAWSPDGRWLALHDSRDVVVHDATDLAEVARWTSPAPVRVVRQAPAGSVLAVGCGGTSGEGGGEAGQSPPAGDVWLVDPVRPDGARRVPGRGSPVEGLAFDPTGRFLAIADGRVRIVAVDSLETVSESDQGPSSIGFSPCGEWFVRGGPGRLELFEVQGGTLGQRSGRSLPRHVPAVIPPAPARSARPVGESLSDAIVGGWLGGQAGGEKPEAIVISPDFELFAEPCESGVTRIRTVSDGELQALLTGRMPVGFSADGAVALTGDGADGGRTIVWETRTGRELATLPFTCKGWISPSGDRVAALVVGERELRIFRTRDSTPTHAIELGSGPVVALAVGDEGRRVAVGTTGRIRVFEVQTGRLVDSAPCRTAGAGAGLVALAFGAGTSLWAAEESAGIVSFHRVDRGSVMAGPRTSPRTIPHAVFASDGRTLVTGDSQGTIVVWDGTAASVTRRWEEKGFHPIAISPDGRRLVLSGREGVTRIRPLAGQGPSQDLRGHSAPPLCAAVSRDGQLLATLTAGGEARVWPMAGGRPLAALAWRSAATTAIAFNDDGSLVVVGSADEGIRVVSTQSGKAVRSFERDEVGPVSALAFAGRGTTLVVGLRTGEIRLLGVDEA